MSERGTDNRRLEGAGDVPQGDTGLLEERIDDMAVELLAGLCNNLAYALAGLRSRSDSRGEIRELAAEYAAGIGVVLGIWEMAKVEVVGGPLLDELFFRSQSYD